MDLLGSSMERRPLYAPAAKNRASARDEMSRTKFRELLAGHFSTIPSPPHPHSYPSEDLRNSKRKTLSWSAACWSAIISILLKRHAGRRRTHQQHHHDTYADVAWSRIFSISELDYFQVRRHHQCLFRNSFHFGSHLRVLSVLVLPRRWDSVIIAVKKIKKTPFSFLDNDDAPSQKTPIWGTLWKSKNDSCTYSLLMLNEMIYLCVGICSRLTYKSLCLHLGVKEIHHSRGGGTKRIRPKSKLFKRGWRVDRRRMYNMHGCLGGGR